MDKITKEVLNQVENFCHQRGCNSEIFINNCLLQGIGLPKEKNRPKLMQLMELHSYIELVMKYNSTAKYYKFKLTVSFLTNGPSPVFEQSVLLIDNEMYQKLTSPPPSPKAGVITEYVKRPLILEKIKKHHKDMSIQEKGRHNFIMASKARKATISFVLKNYPEAVVLDNSSGRKEDFLILRYPSDTLYIGEGKTKYQAWKSARDYVLAKKKKILTI